MVGSWALGGSSFGQPSQTPYHNNYYYIYLVGTSQGYLANN